MNWGELAKKALELSAKDAIDELAPDLVDKKPIEDYYKRLYLTVIPPIAQRQYRAFTKDIGIPIDPEDTAAWDAVILRFLLTGGIASRITGVTENTRRIIANLIQQGLTEGLSNQQIGRMIRENYVMSVSRAFTIARTELGTASVTGEYVGMERLALDGYPVKKTWMHGGGRKNPRDQHIALDGVTIGINEYFLSNGFRMTRPYDPQAPASETINCTCALSWSIR